MMVKKHEVSARFTVRNVVSVSEPILEHDLDLKIILIVRPL